VERILVLAPGAPRVRQGYGSETLDQIEELIAG